MKHLSQHRLWIGLLMLAALILFAILPLLDAAQGAVANRLARVRAENAKYDQELRQMREDMETAKTMDNRLGANEAERLLAPVDRLHAAALMENAAAEKQLSHFTYTLSPEQKTSADAEGKTEELSASSITMKADAPLDTHIYRFIDSLPALLPGRLKLKQLSLEYAPQNDANALDNLHMTATFEWLSNGAQHDVAVAQ